jgi:phosphoribosyl 1,2-cyclic phosphodiesterase
MIEIKSLASGSSGNAYRVSDSKTPLLLECGISYKKLQEGLEFRLSEIEGCLVTHSHLDHSKESEKLFSSGIDVYMSKGTADKLNLKSHRLKIIKAHEQFNINDWSILPFDVHHDDPEPLNFLIQKGEEKLVYLTDTFYCKYKFNDLNYIMIECNYSKKILDENIAAGKVPMIHRNRLLKSHFSLQNVKDFLKANDLSKVREIWLLHLSDRNSNAKLFKEEIQELTGKMVKVAEKYKGGNINVK